MRSSPFILGIAALCLSCRQFPEEPVVIAKTSVAGDSLVLTADAPTRIRVGEPLRFRAVARNASGRQLTLSHWSDVPRWNFVVRRTPNGRAVFWLFNAISAQQNQRMLLPGDSLVFDYSWLQNTNDTEVQASPGEYYVQAYLNLAVDPFPATPALRIAIEPE